MTQEERMIQRDPLGSAIDALNDELNRQRRKFWCVLLNKGHENPCYCFIGEVPEVLKGFRIIRASQVWEAYYSFMENMTPAEIWLAGMTQIKVF